MNAAKCSIAVAGLALLMAQAVFAEGNATRGHVDTRGKPLPVLDPYLYSQNLAKHTKLVNCELEDGSTSLCFEITVWSTPHEDGPYCPETTEDTGGIYIYDGETNPGLRPMDGDFVADMEKDGYDIVDEEGNVRYVELDLSGDGPPPEMDPEKNYCIEVEVDKSLKLTYRIPAYPEYAEEPTEMSNASKIVGLSLFGLPVNGLPPTVTGGVDGQGTGAGNVPALDPCGGHINEGYYHSHIFAETINGKLRRNGVDKVRCESVPQKYEAELIGYAMDGFPIYGRKEMTGVEPRDLDECNGHYGPTPHYPWGMYHYHAKHDEHVDIPRCLSGTLAKEQLIVE